MRKFDVKYGAYGVHFWSVRAKIVPTFGIIVSIFGIAHPKKMQGKIVKIKKNGTNDQSLPGRDEI